MEWAVWAASCDSEDEIDQEAYEGVAAESSTNHSQASIDFAFVNKAASAKNGLASGDSVKAEAGKKPPHTDVRDLTHLGKKDGHKIPVPHCIRPTLTVNVAQKDGVFYSESKHLAIAATTDEEELFAQEDRGESAEEHHSSATGFEDSRKQNPGRSVVQKKKRSLAEDGQGPASKINKVSEQPQKNQMPRASKECGESASDPTPCQLSESFQADHMEENYAAEEPVNSTQSTELFTPSKEVHAGEVMYSCTECDAKLKNISRLNRHFSRYHTETPYKCPECSKHFETSGGLHAHRQRLHSVEKPLQYSECNTTLNSLLLNGHNLEAHPVDKCFIRPECSRAFSYPDGLRHHQLAIHNTTKLFHCSKCTTTVNSILLLNQHCLEAHHARKVFDCPKCERVFKCQESVRQHCLEAHRNAPKVFDCPKCKRVFKCQESVRQHCLEAHRNAAKVFDCPKCKRDFKCQEPVRQHCLEAHRNAPKVFDCPKCKKVFKCQESVRQHCLEAHRNAPKVFDCPNCMRVFKCQESVHQHCLAIHAAKKPSLAQTAT